MVFTSNVLAGVRLSMRGYVVLACDHCLLFLPREKFCTALVLYFPKENESNEPSTTSSLSYRCFLRLLKNLGTFARPCALSDSHFSIRALTVGQRFSSRNAK